MMVISTALWLALPLASPVLYFGLFRKHPASSRVFLSGSLLLSGGIIFCLAGLFFPVHVMSIAAASGQLLHLAVIALRQRGKNRTQRPLISDKVLQWMLVEVAIFHAALALWIGHLSVTSWLPLAVPLVTLLCSLSIIIVFLIKHSSTRWVKTLLIMFLLWYLFMFAKDSYESLSLWRSQISQGMQPSMSVSDLVDEAVRAQIVTPYISTLGRLPDYERERAIDLLAKRLPESVPMRERSLEALGQLMDVKALAEIIASEWDPENPFTDGTTLDVLAYSGVKQYADMIFSAYCAGAHYQNDHVVFNLRELLGAEFEPYLVAKVGCGIQKESAWALEMLRVWNATESIRWNWKDDYEITLPEVVRILKPDQLNQQRVQMLIHAYSYTGKDSQDEMKQEITDLFSLHAGEAVDLLSPHLASERSRLDVLELLERLPNEVSIHSLIQNVWKSDEQIPNILVATALSDHRFIEQHPEFITTFVNAIEQPASPDISIIAQRVLEQADDLTQYIVTRLLLLLESKEDRVRRASSEILLTHFHSDYWWMRGYADTTTERLIHRTASASEEYHYEAFQLLNDMAEVAGSRSHKTKQEWLHIAIARYWPEDGVIRYPSLALALAEKIPKEKLSPELVRYAFSNDVSPEIREESIRMLCRLNTDEGAIRLFMESFSNRKEAWSAWYVIRAIAARSQGVDLPSVLRANWKASYHVPSVQVLQVLDPERGEHLVSILRCWGSNVPELVDSAREVLKRSDSRVMLPALLRELAKRGPTSVRVGIVNLVAELDVDSSQREQVRNALKGICGIGLFQFRDPDREVLRAAFETLGKI